MEKTFEDFYTVFDRFVFDKFRTISVRDSKSVPVTDERLALAVTLNENVKAFGYTFSAEGLSLIAGSPELPNMFDRFKELVPMVEAKPMYPDFPSRVMEMEEAEFRFHQLIHYYSTYGLEKIRGVKVERGWLPSEKETEKTESDDTLIGLKLVDVIDFKNLYGFVLKGLLSKKERMTYEERIMAAHCMGEWGDSIDYNDIEIPFKENLDIVFAYIFEKFSEDEFYRAAKGFCKHTGDVFRGIKAVTFNSNTRLSTSDKRKLVCLLEQYPVSDLRANLILTNKKSYDIIRLLEFLSYNRFSKSPDHKEAVRALRNGELKSWEGQAKYLLEKESEDNESALDFISKRPGIMVRWVSWLLKLGYSRFELLIRLLPVADRLNAVTLNDVLVFFSGEGKEREGAKDVIYVFSKLLKAKLSSIDTPIKGKKVFFDPGEFAPDFMSVSGNKKTAVGKYIPSGASIKIPDEVRYVRFFTYWNDFMCVDVDLHTYGINTKDRDYVHVGWNAQYNNYGMITSGDITHSDAAEFVDIDLQASLPLVVFRIENYSGEDFAYIETCFCGLMAVKKISEEVRLYDPKNCIFSSDLTFFKGNDMVYAFLDTKKRVLTLCGKPTNKLEFMYGFVVAETERLLIRPEFTITEYLKLLFEAQNVETVSTKEEADAVLSIAKCEGAISLLDNNYWLDL